MQSTNRFGFNDIKIPFYFIHSDDRYYINSNGI